MKNKLLSMKEKGLALLQSLKSKLKNIHLGKSGPKKSKKKKQTKTNIWTIFANILLGIKATFNTLFIIAFLGGLLGTGVVFGYAVSLFDKVTVPQTEDLVKQVNDISSISEIRYADGSMISAIESDLLRTSVSSDAISTQINLIKKVLPKAKTIGILYTQSEPNSVVQKDEAKRLLEEKGFTVVEKTILDSNNVKAAAESLMAEVDMVFVPTDNIISSTMETVKQVSIKHKVPVFGGSTEMIAVGGLYNYGTNYEELGRQTARMLVRVLKGEKPENIAVELPEKLELHTNKEMADALGIDISKLESKE